MNTKYNIPAGVNRQPEGEVIRLRTTAGNIDIDWAATVENGLVEDMTENNWDLIRLVNNLVVSDGFFLDTRLNPVKIGRPSEIVAYEVIM